MTNRTRQPPYEKYVCIHKRHSQVKQTSPFGTPRRFYSIEDDGSVQEESRDRGCCAVCSLEDGRVAGCCQYAEIHLLS